MADISIFKYEVLKIFGDSVSDGRIDSLCHRNRNP
jgi:hypothetical protein